MDFSSDDPFACFGVYDKPTQSDARSEDPFACFGGDDGSNGDGVSKSTNTSSTNDSKVAEARQAYASIASLPTGIQPLHIVNLGTYADRFEVYECSQQDRPVKWA